MSTLPSVLALTSIADGANIVAADHRNNYSAIQTCENALLGILDDGATGQFFAGNGTTVSWAYPPGYELGYKEITAPVNVVSTNSAAPTAVITGDALTFDGTTAYWFEFYTPRLDRGTTYVRVQLFLDTTDQGIIADTGSVGGGTYKRKITPAAGSKTPKIMGYVDAGTGIVAAGASGVNTNMPAFLRVVKA